MNSHPRMVGFADARNSQPSFGGHNLHRAWLSQHLQHAIDLSEGRLAGSDLSGIGEDGSH